MTTNEPKSSSPLNDSRPRPKVIGLTGGIASGKSLVAGMFARLGAAVIDADAIAREVLRSPEVSENLRKGWGAEVFDAGRPDRARVAEIAFRDPQKLRELTNWVHPPTIREMRAQLDRALEDRGVPLIVIDAPLLLETDLAPWCDALLFVDAHPALRSARARAERGWPDDEVARREAAQAPLAEKRAGAAVLIDNNGSEEETSARVARLFQQWVSGSRPSPNPGCNTEGEKNG